MFRFFYLKLVMLLVLTNGAVAVSDSSFFEERGITFSASLNGDHLPEYTRGLPKPYFVNALHWIDGRGQEKALLMRPSDDGILGSVKDPPSILIWSAAGLLYGEAGTLSYWVCPDWAVGDMSTRVGAGEFGPMLINISAFENAYYNIFLRTDTRGPNFYIWLIDENGSSHGLNYSEAFNSWRAGEWQHIVITWDGKKGMSFYNNGELKYSSRRPFKAVTPWNIAFSASRPMDRPAMARYFSAAYQDVIMMDRMVDEQEAQDLYNGNLAALRKIESNVSRISQQLEERKEILFLEEDDEQRITLVSSQNVVGGTIRQLPIAELDLKFIRGHQLMDGQFHPRVRFSQGGLDFERVMQVQLGEEALCNYLYIYGRPGRSGEKGSFFTVDSSAKFKLPTASEMTRISLDPAASQIEVLIPEASEVGEIIPYHVRELNVLSRESVDFEKLTSFGTKEDLGTSAEEILRRHNALDRTVLIPGTAHSVNLIKVEPTMQLQLASSKHEEDTAVASIRLNLKITPSSKEDIMRFRIFNPYNNAVHYFYADVQLKFEEGIHKHYLIDIELEASGMIFPEGNRTIIEVTSSNGFKFVAEPRLLLNRVPLRDEVEAFALNYIRQIKNEFSEHMAWNFVFLRRGIETENKLTRAIDTILRFDPDNEMANQMQSWMPVVPWPPHNIEPDGPEEFPLWARYARMAAMEARNVIHWWIHRRQDETGYMVGNADHWNDDTKLFNEYTFLGLLAGDDYLIRAIERFLEAHWEISGQMEKGWSKMLTDIVHSAEEGNYLQPSLALFRYGEPKYLNRLMETAANVDYWTGIDSRGHRQFKSNFFTASSMRTDGNHGYDVGLNATAMIPTMYLAWYSRHPVATRQFLEWVDGWIDAIYEKTEEKESGYYPSGIHFESGKLLPDKKSYPGELSIMFAAAYYLSGDPVYLEAIIGYIERGSDDWISYTEMTAADIRHEMDLGDLNPNIMKAAEKRANLIEEDVFFQRGLLHQELPGVLGWLESGDVKYLELTTFNAWRNNYRARNIYTIIDPHKDRVYPWGRYVLPWMYLGGNALNTRGSGPWPTICVTWDDAGYDFAALVLEKKPDRLLIEAYNFGEKRNITMRVWMLEPGLYELKTMDKEDRVLSNSEHLLYRGETVSIFFPEEEGIYILLRKKSSYDWSPERYDLALSKVDLPRKKDDGRLEVFVYNIGSKRSEPTVMRLESESGYIEESIIPAIDAPFDFVSKSVSVYFPLGNIASGTELTLTVNPDGLADEITKVNNQITFKLE